MNLYDLFNEEKVRLDPKCWTGKKIGNPKTKVKGGVRVNNCVPAESVAENAGQPLSVQQLATISDAALDAAYGYGRSTPGNTFGWQANMKSAAYAKQMIDQGVTDIEAISDAIHKGWNTTAQAFVQDPEQFDDTAKLAAAGKLEAKLQQRAQLMKQNYGQLPEEEKEKDRVVARALLQAIRGEQGVAEGQLESNTPDPVVVVQDLKGNILDKINLSVAAQKYKLGQPQNIKNQLAHQNYTKVGNYTIVSPMSGQPQDATTQGVAETELEEVDRRGFLKGLGAAAVAGGALAGQKTTEKKVPNDKVAYYLLGEYAAISHWSSYIPEMKSWENELKPYIEDIWLSQEAGDLPDEFDQAYTNGFNHTNQFLDSYDIKSKSVGEAKQIANRWANLWKPRHDKLILRLTKSNESIEQGMAEGVMYGAENLDVGDDVIISGNVELKGATGVIDSFGQDKRFVVVNLYNHGKHSFHSSDVSANDHDNDEHDDDVLDEKSVSQAQFRTMAAAAHNPKFAKKVGISQDVAQEFNQADKKSNYKKLPARATEGKQQKGADYRDPKEVDYDDEYDAMVARVKKLAGLGPMKTTYDPTKRQYRNMPTAVQPKK